MDDKKEPGSLLETLLKRVPVMDGGGRRRLTAGTIVVLAILLLLPGPFAVITEAIVKRDVSLSLFLVTGALLIYATGVIVELIGEVFLARAVANAAWSYVAAVERVRRLAPLKRPLGWLASVCIWGSIRAAGYFVLGLFGANRWRMKLRGLSPSARAYYDCKSAIPDALRDALEYGLGNKAEFGRKALVDRLSDAESRRWARRLLERPKDVLALVSAIVLALIFAIFSTSPSYRLSAGATEQLRAARNALGEVAQNLDETASRVGDPMAIDDRGRLSRNLSLLAQDARAAVARSDSTYLDRDPGSMTAHFASFASLDGPFFLHLSLVESQIKGYDAKEKSDIPSPSDQRLKDLYARAATSRLNLNAAMRNVRDEVANGLRQRLLINLGAAVATLFLYVAFFNTLTSATLSVIEALALEHSDSSQAPGIFDVADAAVADDITLSRGGLESGTGVDMGQPPAEEHA